jgi:hypothetical protein
MDTKTSLQFEDLPAPASQTGKCPGRKSCKDKRSKKRRILGKLAFSGLLLWAGARYLRFEVPMSFTLADVVNCSLGQMSRNELTDECLCSGMADPV